MMMRNRGGEHMTVRPEATVEETRQFAEPAFVPQRQDVGKKDSVAIFLDGAWCDGCGYRAQGAHQVDVSLTARRGECPSDWRS
jgi:hypothetical protein